MSSRNDQINVPDVHEVRKELDSKIEKSETEINKRVSWEHFRWIGGAITALVIGSLIYMFNMILDSKERLTTLETKMEDSKERLTKVEAKVEELHQKRENQ